VEVLEGLSSGQEIITGPFKTLHTLKEGEQVKVEVENKGGNLAESGASL
jgi:hypothetical protein